MPLFRTLVQIEILSDSPVPDDGDLSAINYQITDGPWSGVVTQVGRTQVNQATMALLLTAQGSDPAFLLEQVSDDGEDEDPDRDCDDLCLPHREGCDGYCNHENHVNQCWAYPA